MADQGRALLGVVQREVIGAVRDAVAELITGRNGGTVDASYAGTGFAGKVLELVDANHPILGVLARLTSSSPGGTSTSLHFWRDEPVDGSPLGIALVLRNANAVAALSMVPAAGMRLVAQAAGFSAGQSVEVPVSGDVVIRVTATITGDGAAVALGVGAPVEVLRLAVGDRIELGITRASTGSVLGVDGGPSILLGTVDAGAFVANTPSNPLERGSYLRLQGGRVEVAPGFVRSLLPVNLSFPLDIDFNATPDLGLLLNSSSGLRARFAGDGGAHWLDVAVDVIDVVGGSALNLSFATSLGFEIPGTPITAHIDGLGLRAPISLRLGAPMLPDVAAISALEPTGAAVSLALPVLSGAGAFTRVGQDLVGALSVTLPSMSANAFGVLSPADGDRPLSFLVIMGATFPPPGIQIGFGFAISGIGGVVGVNRRIDRDALLRAVSDGTAAQLLFPSDPAGAGRAAIETLPRLFPAARGSVIAGPMFQMSWGGRIVTLSVAVLVEASTQVRLTILGKLVVALPDPAAPLVFLQATFAGFIDPGGPTAMFVASLTGSHIAGCPLTGDLLLLTRGGSDPAFVLSAGGFHPAFTPPRGVPALRRLAMDLCPVPWIDLRCENYFAITSNTIQLGARIEIGAEVSGCGIHGWLAYDALVYLSPFRFEADMSGGVSLRAFGESLVGISFALRLEGPAPYLARGRGSIDLFLFDVSFDFEIGWGSPAPPAPKPVDVASQLRTAISKPSAWHLRGEPPAGLLLSAAARQSLLDATCVDPYGAISVRQEVVPLGVTIQRMQGIPIEPQRWDLSGAQFGPGEPAARTIDIRAQFAPGLYLGECSDDEALTRSAFVSLKSGIDMFPAAAAGADARSVTLVWEEKVIARDLPAPVECPTGLIGAVDRLLRMATAVTSLDQMFWEVSAFKVLSVAATAPVTAAYRWSTGPAATAEMPGFDPADPDGPRFDTPLELNQTLYGFDEFRTVEAWEVLN